MDTDIIAPMAIFFFCIALLTFWAKKRWKKKPQPKAISRSGNEVGGRWTAERPEPEPPERPREPEPEPPEKKSEE